MVDYRRYYLKGGSWFFTVNLRDRESRFLVQRIDALRQAVAIVHKQKPFHIDAWVVLPEHLHCVWTLPDNDSDFPSRWRAIKKHFSGLTGAHDVWQPRYWEHAIRNQKDYRSHVDYIYINPVKHGWVRQVRDWPYSTFHRDVSRSLYPVDWGGEVKELLCGERC
ncbi:TPA: REP-associated tyrosine transposase [Klebsiella michiganensis]|uniref:Transposase n=3 Tax=Klebsiella TaxID=570 RepID=A0AAJ1KSZ5_9ENTR|nr:MULTISPECIES: transposase [Klebsiella]AKL37879.1 hypothetical protein AB185_29965 [Klebsiella oxytoca]AFN30970.1 Transposase-like protein [Klebsiella michiganensis E718]ARB24061.1 transposase [Klebsiella oxytoca]ASK75841.1 transposase [Klebsiella michiganensis]ASZ54964.1 hypothetical protein CKQ55_06650 [Klebsiella michiganensis]